MAADQTPVEGGEPARGKRGDHPRCGAPKRQGPGSCSQAAGWGTPHPGAGRCKLHGGSTPSHVAAGVRVLAEQAVKTYGLPVDISPTEALLAEVRWTAGHVAWLREQIQALEAKMLIWSEAKREDVGAAEFTGVNITEAAVPHVWLDLYQRERKHLLDVCKAAIQAGIEERRVRLAESQGALLASVIRKILDDLKLTPEQNAMVPEVVPRHLRDAA